ncbi:hypothetical protein K470DRAFT_279264 [Piedraia hortae CBS 480.64]|uniref:Cytochrome b561 domain-containing protein n=1 Tax=Piedraia hortae CBS 480.64 TaxID=1314780 RepID=A0A6A7BQB5_9PEZI|nr:hypothetical protein K470DRAFT_279264 [Piedraia hortae CBS 480.64]
MSNLSPPGSSTYDSPTLHIGDGTWDHDRDTFLLPPLVGVNFKTMRYNGMGNRFHNQPGYHRLIVAHGVIATLVFLFIVPLAIWSAKYWRTGGRRAVKMHINLQILTLFLTTVAFVLGWFAVGPKRSLTNPHHVVGLALYAAIWFQFLYGLMMSRIEMKRGAVPNRVPMKVWLHRLLGRAIALLGIVEIALGLTVYGSPKVLFILFAIWSALLLLLYLGLDRYYYEKRPLRYGYDNAESDFSSYVSSSGPRTDFTGPSDHPESSHHWGRDALVAGGALGAYKAYKHRRNRRDAASDWEGSDMTPPPRTRPPPSGVTSSSTRPPPGVSYGTGSVPARGNRLPSSISSDITPSWDGEKHGQRHRDSWKERLLGAGAGAAAVGGWRSFFNRRRRDEYDETPYQPPTGGVHNMVSQGDVSRVQQGQVPMSPGNARPPMNNVGPMSPTQTPMRRPPGPAEEESMISPGPESSYFDEEGGPTLRQSIATFGAVAGFREWNKHRRQRQQWQKDDRLRRQQLEEEELYNRRTGRHYPQQSDATRPRPSLDGTVMTGVTQDPGPGFQGSNPELALNRPNSFHPPLPTGASTVPTSGQTNPSAYTTGSPSAFTSGPTSGYTGTASAYTSGPTSGYTSAPTASGYTNTANAGQGNYSLPPPPPGPPPMQQQRPDYPVVPGSVQMPEGPAQPDPSRILTDAQGRQRRRRSSRADSSPSRNRHNRRGSDVSSMPLTAESASAVGTAQLPVNVRVRMHRDGDHVTFQRVGDGSQSNVESDAPSGRHGRRRRSQASSQQPIQAVPRPPPMRQGSELDLPPPNVQQNVQPNVPQGIPTQGGSQGGPLPPPQVAHMPPLPPQHASPRQQHMPSQQGILSPPAPPFIGSGLSGSPGTAGTGTDVSAFADNRRRRRAERARRLEASRGSNTGGRVEFQ